MLIDSQGQPAGGKPDALDVNPVRLCESVGDTIVQLRSPSCSG